MKQELWLRGWKLNSIRIINRFVELVKESGGDVVQAFPFVDPSEYTIHTPNGDIEVYRYKNYVSIMLRRVYYYVQLDDNPFLDCIYTKEPVATDDTISAPQDGNILDLDWFIGRSMYDVLEDEDVTKNAQALLQYLLTRKYTQSKPTTSRRRIRKEIA